MGYNFQTGNNKSAYGIRKCNSETFICTRLIGVWKKTWRHTSKFQNFLTCIFLGAGLGVMDQFRGLRAHPLLRRLISSCGDTLQDPCDSVDELKLKIFSHVLAGDHLTPTSYASNYRLKILS
jgi:hypothetical protein